jgi:hypothetical protein
LSQPPTLALRRSESPWFSDEVNPNGLSDAQLAQPGDISAAMMIPMSPESASCAGRRSEPGPYLTGGSSMIVPQLVNARLVSTRKFDSLV